MVRFSVEAPTPGKDRSPATSEQEKAAIVALCEKFAPLMFDSLKVYISAAAD